MLFELLIPFRKFIKTIDCIALKPHKLPRTTFRCESFSLQRHKLSHFLNIWHYHEELELVLILQSTGTRFIGDSIEPFMPGDMVLVGSQLPHLWLNDKIYFEGNGLEAEALVIHFHPKCFGEKFFNIPEMHKIKELIKGSHTGINITGINKAKISKLIKEIFNEDESGKVITLLNILRLISEEPDIRYIASPTFVSNFKKNANSRLDKVYEYVLNHFKEDIELATVAGIVNMNPSAFSRFFSESVNKTFVEFLNEIRIGYVCRLFLDKSDKNISEIAFESGFNSLSNFNRQFKNITGKTPSTFVNTHIVNEN